MPVELAQKFEEYKIARAKKDFAASDVLRKQFAEKGFKILDTKDGSRWQRI